MKILVRKDQNIDLTKLTGNQIQISENGGNIEVCIESETKSKVEHSRTKSYTMVNRSLKKEKFEKRLKEYLGKSFTFEPFEFKSVIDNVLVKILDLSGNVVCERTVKQLYNSLRQGNKFSLIAGMKRRSSQENANRIVEKYLDGKFKFMPFEYKTIKKTGMITITDFSGNIVDFRDYQHIYVRVCQNRKISPNLNVVKNSNACKSLNDMFKGVFIIKAEKPRDKFTKHSFFSVFDKSGIYLTTSTYENLVKTKNDLLKYQ